MVFTVDGDCGAGGVIVVEADPDIGRLQITNAPALLTPLPAASNNTTAINQRYDGTSCPYTLDRGEWFVTVGTCSTFGPPPPPLVVDAGNDGDGGDTADAGPVADAGSPATPPLFCTAGYHSCKAALEVGVLWFTCHGAAVSGRGWRASLLAMAALVMAALAPLGCTDPVCPDAEAFIVNEDGTCAQQPQQFTLAASGCHISINGAGEETGLPSRGAMDGNPVPLRQGDFILYSDQPQFRLCRARRVDYRLELSCVDAADAPVCQATLTEPGP